jgi:hypothetical protein
MRMMQALVDGSTIHVLPVIKGLVSEESKVTAALDEIKPDAVGISVSKEELEGLKNKETYEEYEMSTLEEVYRVYLESFGEVRLPAPAYVTTMDLCATRSLPLIPIDMNDEQYTEEYCQRIGGSEIVREAMFTRSVSRRRFIISSPEEFVADWDRKVNRAKGFRELERAREEHMTGALRSMARQYKTILAVIEQERAQGVVDLLSAPPVAEQEH